MEAFPRPGTLDKMELARFLAQGAIIYEPSLNVLFQCETPKLFKLRCFRFDYLDGFRSRT